MAVSGLRQFLLKYFIFLVPPLILDSGACWSKPLDGIEVRRPCAVGAAVTVRNNEVKDYNNGKLVLKLVLSHTDFTFVDLPAPNEPTTTPPYAISRSVTELVNGIEWYSTEKYPFGMHPDQNVQCSRFLRSYRLSVGLLSKYLTLKVRKCACTRVFELIIQWEICTNIMTFLLSICKRYPQIAHLCDILAFMFY